MNTLCNLHGNLVQCSRTSCMRMHIAQSGRKLSGGLPPIQNAHARCVRVGAAAEEPEEQRPTTFVAEDAASFSVEAQSKDQWIRFFLVLGVVMGVLHARVYVNQTGTTSIWQHMITLILTTGLFDNYVLGFEEVLVEPQFAMVGILAFFALFHSGLAYLRPYGEELIGGRAYRVVFGSVSLPLAAVALFYFINHRYDGTALWDIRSVAGVHTAVWIANFVSFLFLYPSTFNLLEVAAVEKPKLHLYETGVMRITRHPQAWGQLLWCVAHTAWIGNSFMVWTSLALCGHHFLGCYHGDFRLERKYGESFEEVKGRTSIVPFAAIMDGRQQLPADYWKEWIRVPYVAVVIFTIGAYYAHPLMQQAAYFLNW